MNTYTVCMFKRDATAIKSYALTNSTNMAYVIMFAIATANCPFMQSVVTIQSLKSWDLDTLEYGQITMAMKAGMGCGLTTAKFAAYKMIWGSRDSIYNKYIECTRKELGYIEFWHYCMDVLSGMGMVKAAFATQMLFNELGCIDIHNARELGYSKCPAGKAKKNRGTYLTIQSVKSSSQWWDDWCIMLASKYGKIFPTGDYVSELHRIAIIGK